MIYVSDAWREHQRWRFMRPDAARLWKAGPSRTRADTVLFHYSFRDRKYDPDQPRVPAGNPDGGQWTNGSGISGQPKVRLAFAGPAAAGVRATARLGLMLYTYMSGQNGPDKQAIVAFGARKFSSGAGELDFSTAQSLDRDEVGQVCPRLDEVQQRTDRAAAAITNSGRRLTPQQYGTAVHVNLSQQIKDIDDPRFIAERSFVKERREARYGEKGSIRVDVLENVGNGTVCVYDIKTGKAVLDQERMIEIASNVFVRYPATRRIIVSEIRPIR